MGKLIVSYTTRQIAVAVPAVAGGGFICQLNPPQAVTTRPLTMGLTKLRVVLTTAVQGTFGLVAAATAGTPTAPGTVLGQRVSLGNHGYGGSAGPGRIITAWGLGLDPTVAAAPLYYEQDLLPATVGAGFEWTWPEDDPLTENMEETVSGKGLLLQNLNAGASPAVIVTARWLEFSTSD